MTEQFNLSRRLKTTASFVDTKQLFADIGSDHAYLPCYICQLHPQARAIAGEVNTGPFNSARNTVRRLGLETQVDVRLGDGLEVLHEDEKTQVVIAGMGGSLIRSILEKGSKKMKYITRIIAQPNIDGRDVREVLSNYSFEICHETILKENGHIYEIIVAERSENHPEKHLSEKEILFGPQLLKEKPAIFMEKWNLERNHYKTVIAQMNKAKVKDHGKIMQYQKELQWIEEVLSDGESIDK